MPSTEQSQKNSPPVDEQISKTDESQIDLHATRRLLEQGNVDSAWRSVQQLLINNPQDAEIIFLAAQIFAAKKQWLEAAQVLEGIPLDNPNLGLIAVGQSADWLQQAGLWELSAAKYRAILNELPDAPLPHRRLAFMLNHMGMRMEAIQHLRRLLDLGDIKQYELCAMIEMFEPFHDPAITKEFSSRVPLTSLAEARRLLAEGELKAANIEIAIVERELPESSAVSAFRGYLLAAQGDTDGLSSWIGSVPPGVEQYPEFWTAVGKWMLQSNRDPEAIYAFAKAILLNPGSRVNYLELAKTLSSASQQQVATDFNHRGALLTELYQAVQYVGADGRDAEKIKRISELLAELHRPREALAWLVIGLHCGLKLDSSVAEFKTKLESKALKQSDQSSKWLLCGLELDDFPRPQLETLATLTHEEQSASAGQMKFEGISTRNVSAELGLDFRYASRAPPAGMLIYQSFGGGVACLDFDQDGWCDFYFAQADGTPEERTEKSGNVLMKSLRGANFYDVSTHAQVNDRGYGQTVNVSDINQDGFPDLLVGNFGSNVLLLNSGDGTFRDASEPAGFNMYRTVTTGLCAADLDHDGLPEVIEINYTDDPLVLTKRCRDYKGFERACSPTHFKPGFDHVWKNLGDGRFDRFMPIELNRETARYGLGVIVANLDGLPGNEIFVANDMTPNELWVGDIVDGTVSYKDVATYKGCALGVQNTPSACMGVALGDFDGNGAQDLFVTNLYHESNDLFMQQRAGVFTNQATKTGIHDYSFNSLGFGTQAIDIDNNGDLDLVVLNGHVDDYTHRNIPFRMLPQLLLGDRRRFSLVPPDVAGDFFARPTLGRALARCDFNRDGAVDWIATHLDETVAMVKNESKIQNWIQLELVGTRSERDAIGTTVIADLGNKGKSQFAVATGDGYMARNEQIVSIGVGMTHSVNSLTIIWPEGEQQSFENIAVNKRYLIIEQRNGLFERK